MAVRAIRGATQLDVDEREHLLERSAELVRAVLEANDLENADLISILFTVTPDLHSEFPAVAGRPDRADRRTADVHAGDRRPARPAARGPADGAHRDPAIPGEDPARLPARRGSSPSDLTGAQCRLAGPPAPARSWGCNSRPSLVASVASLPTLLSPGREAP